MTDEPKDTTEESDPDRLEREEPPIDHAEDANPDLVPPDLRDDQ